MIFVDYPGHFIAAVFLVSLAILMVLAFRAEQLRKMKLWKWLLVFLQYASIVILLLILWNPSQPQMSQTDFKNSVLVLFDTSRSMSIVEDGQEDRLQKAVKIFKEKLTPLDPQGPNYKIYGFDRSTYYSNTVDSLRQWGRQTNMHSAFSLLEKYETTERSSDPNLSLKKGQVVGAVIFTDGQADDKNVRSYLPLANKDLQIVLVGVGAKIPRSDVEIKSIKAPSRVTVDTAFAVEVAVAGENISDRTVTIELFKNDYVIASKQIETSTLSNDVTLEFVIGADRLGRHSLSARAKTVTEEVNPANNARSTMVQVVENARLNVLLYSQVANFNIGKIRQALARDKKIHLDVGLDAVINPALAENAKKKCGFVKLPENQKGFYKYDVIILGPCALDNLSRSQIDGLYSFVVDRGGGLVLLPGKSKYSPSSWKNKKIKALIPVFFETSTIAGRRRSRSRIEITIEGEDSKIMNPAGLKDYDIFTSAYYRNIIKKPAAAAYAFAGSDAIVTVHRIGRGRVCMLNVSKLFQWYREDMEGGLLHKFMSGLTAYLGRVTNLEATIELFAERANEQTDKIKFDAYVYDKSFNAVSEATVLLNIGEKVLHMDQVSRGHYVAEIEDIVDQSIIATVQAEFDGTFLGEKTIATNLPPARNEMANIELDTAFLRALAKRFGAEYFDADEVDKEVVEMFEAKTHVSSLSRMESIWPKWSLLLALCLILSINWFIRRAKGLI